MDRADILHLVDPPNGWRDHLVNAAIVAGLGAFTTLAAITAAGIRADPMTALIAAGISAGINFFSSLAIQRGLKERE